MTIDGAATKRYQKQTWTSCNIIEIDICNTTDCSDACNETTTDVVELNMADFLNATQGGCQVIKNATGDLLVSQSYIPYVPNASDEAYHEFYENLWKNDFGCQAPPTQPPLSAAAAAAPAFLAALAALAARFL